MSAQAVIDSLEFARTGQTLRGSLPIPTLIRLQGSLFDGPGEVWFEVKGGHDARRRPVLMLEIGGVLGLRCQRCLGRLDYALQLSNTLLLVSAGEVASGSLDEEDAEWVEASGELDVANLVEDEIILSLPYAPRHGEGLCRHNINVVADGAVGSAFAKLAALKRNNH